MSIKRARNEIRKAFEKDPSFRKVYQSNIAMMIYDDQNNDHPSNLSRVEGCNAMADKLLTMIFLQH